MSLSPQPGLNTCSSSPAQSYDDALQQFERLQAKESQSLNPLCLSEVLTHGVKTQRAIVFLHGYTNSPCQFHQLGQQFYEQGYNVYIPVQPYHGRRDPLTTEQSHLTAESLVEYVNRALDLAHGLGDQITLVGLSGGGTATAWAAQFRRDVDRAVLIAPIFGFRPIPVLLTSLMDWVFLTLPNFYRWWDVKRKTGAGGLNHAYPRYSSHAVAQIMRLGLFVHQVAHHHPPAAGSILVITNASDPIPNQRLIDAVVTQWQLQGANVQTYHFAARLKLLHDLIDPDQPLQQVNLVYPVLLQLITEPIVV